MLIPRAGDGPSHHLQGPDGTRWTGANRGNVVSSGRDDIAAPCLLNRQDTFWSIIESVEMHVQVVTRHAIAAGIVWSVACHVTQPPMRIQSTCMCPLRPRLAPSSGEGSQGACSERPHTRPPFSPSVALCSAITSALGSGDALLGRHGRQTNRGFVPPAAPPTPQPAT
jgi:hypothetical protein